VRPCWRDVGGSHYLAMKKCDDLNQHTDVAFRGGGINLELQTTITIK
jgi:hypothetical protein